MSRPRIKPEPPLPFSPRPVRRISHRPHDREDPMTYWYPPPERGQSRMVSFRIPEQMDNVMEAMIAQRVGPWRTKTDFLRSAVGALIRIATEEVDSRFWKAIHKLEMAYDQRRVDAISTYHREFFGEALNQAKRMVDDGEKIPARKYLRGLMRETEAMDSPPFKRARARFWRSAEVKKIMGSQYEREG